MKKKNKKGDVYSYERFALELKQLKRIRQKIRKIKIKILKLEQKLEKN